MKKYIFLLFLLAQSIIFSLSDNEISRRRIKKVSAFKIAQNLKINDITINHVRLLALLGTQFITFEPLKNAIQTRDLSKGSVLKEFTVTPPHFAPNVSPNQKYAIALRKIGTQFNTDIWDMQSGKLLHTLPLSSSKISPDSLLIAAPDERTPKVQVWDIQKGEKLYTISGYTAIFSDNSKLIATTQEGTPYIWDTNAGLVLMDMRSLL